MPIPNSLLSFAEQRYQLIDLPNDDCPVHLAMAMPIGGDGGGNVRAAGFLPPAARMGTGRTPSGRGLSVERAHISALGEAAQLVSSCAWGDEEIVKSHFDKLTGSKFLPNEILMISDDQFSTRNDWNAQQGGHDWIPEKFDFKSETEWIKLPSLDAQSTAWFPAASVYIGWQNKGDKGAYCIADTNGTAAGETLEGATVSAFLELVERDATAVWWHGQHHRPSLDISNLIIPEHFQEWLSSRSRLYQVLDLTHDLDIPVFAAVSSEVDGKFIALGISADFDPATALLSALTEMCQMEFNLSMAKDNPAMITGTPLGKWVDEVSLLTAAHLQPSSIEAATTCKVPSVVANSHEQMNWIKDVCKGHGLEAFIVDMTRPEIGIPTVRVLMPGLCHYKKRDGALRLIDVPNKLGWLQKPKGPGEFNTTPLMM